MLNKLNKYFWFIFLPIHVYFLIGLYYIEYVNWYVVLALWVLLSGFGVGVTLHRLLAHKSFETHQWIKNLLSLISCITAQGSPIFWVNIHRGYHHKNSDTDLDPHTPKKGYLWSYFIWQNVIDAEKLNYKYSTDLLRDPWQKFLNNNYFQIVMLVWLLAMLAGPEVFLSLIFAQIITMHQEFCVNLFCHIRGMPFSYRNFNTKDDTVNYWLFGILGWGVGFHNNHHANPSLYDFGHKKWEVDPTKYLVRLIRKNV